MKRASAMGTVIVLVHLLITVVHGQAHQHLTIFLGPVGNSFVYVVIIGAPLLAMLLLWTTANRAGFGLLALSMAGALIFGIYMHFIAVGPDNIRQVVGEWSGTFVWTSFALAIVEAAGVYVGLHNLGLTQGQPGATQTA